MLHFKEHAIADLKKSIANIIKRHKTIASATQEILMGVACEIETNQSCAGLTQFILGLSEVTEKEVHLSAQARAVGVYMSKLLPVKWDKKSQSFQMVEGDFDYAGAYKTMCETRWDTYEAKKASAEFDADKTLQKAMAMIKGIISKAENGDLATDDPAFLTARKIAKAF